MNVAIEKLLDLARAELGYCEKASNSNLDDKTANAGGNNYTKYARDLAKYGYYQASKQGFEWCDMFHDWLHLVLSGWDPDVAQAVICQTGPYGAGCVFSGRYYKEQGRFFTDPKPGDQIFFRDFSHTGVVEKVENGIVTTIEGNAGNKVQRLTYKVGDPKIDGYGRPKWELYDKILDSKPVEKPVEKPVSTTEIKKGDVVSVASNATYYNGVPVPSWVKKKQWIVCEKPEGDRVVIDKSADGQSSIESPISAKYLTVVKPATTSKPTTTAKPAGELDFAQSFNTAKAGAYKVTANGGLHLRSGASTAKTSLEVMAKGSRVTCYGYHTGVWLYVVSASGKTGFCHSDYLSKV